MEISALGFLIASCSLLFACSCMLHLDHFQHVYVSWWELLTKSFTRGCSAALPLPPGSFGLPWLGETLQFIHALQGGDLQRFLRHRTARFGSKTFKTHIFFKPTAIVQGASANRFLAASENQQLLVNSWAPSTLRIVGPHAPPAKHGAAHRSLRHIMTSCLCPAALQKLVGKADILTRHHFASCWKDHSDLTLVPLLKLHTFRMACSLLASIEDEAVVARLYPLFKTWQGGIAALPLNLPGTAYHKAMNARNVLVREMGDIIHRRQEDLARLKQSSTGSIKECTLASCSCNDAIDERTREKSDVAKAEQGDTFAALHRGDGIGNAYTEDLLSVLIETRDEKGESLNPEQLQDLLLFLLFAANDSTTCTLAFALKFLEQNPGCLKCLVKEHEAIASQKSIGQDLKWANVQEMKYTWRVLQETLRLMPPAFGGFKEATQELTFDGYQILKGWKMFYSTTTTHHDERYFLEPSKFDPSRFDTKKMQEKSGHPPFAYVPFGIGAHSCPGNNFARMTTSIYLHHLVLKGFTWASIELDENVCIFPIPTLAKGYPVKILKNLC